MVYFLSQSACSYCRQRSFELSTASGNDDVCMKESRLLEKSDERLDLPILMVACDVAKFGEYSGDYILCLSMVALNNEIEASINIAVNPWIWSLGA